MTNDFIDIKKIPKNDDDLNDDEKEEKSTIEQRIIRIEALLHALITTLDKIIDTPDPYEARLEEVASSVNELKEQNKVIAKSLLAVIKQLQTKKEQKLPSTPQLEKSQNIPNSTNALNIGMNNINSNNKIQQSNNSLFNRKIKK